MGANNRASWFAGAEPRNAAEEAFLSTLRAAARDWTPLGVTPADTKSFTGIRPLYVEVAIPGLPRGRNKQTTLQAGYFGGGPAETVVRAEWGDTDLLDAGGQDHEIYLGGMTLPPTDVAALVATWLACQLRRPMERAEWLDATGTAVAAEWRLSDSGRTLASEGSWWVRRRRRPSRVVPLHGRSADEA